MAKKLKSESLIRAGIVILAAQAIFQAANFVYHILTARMLGPAEYAIVASIFSIFYLITVGSAAIQNTAAKYISNLKAFKDDKKISLFFKRGFRKISIVSFFAFIVYLMLSPLISSFLKIPLSAVLISSPAIIIFSLIPFNRGILQGLQKFNSLGANLIIEGAVRVALAMALLTFGLKSNGALAAVSLASAVALIATFPSLKMKKYPGKLELNRKEIYKFTIISFIALFLINAVYNVDVFLVKHFFSAEIAGQYAIISLLGKIIFFGSTTIGLVMFSKISEAHVKNKSQVGSLFKKSLLFAFIIAAIISAVYFLIPQFIIGLLFGAEYLGTANLLGFFGISMALLSLSYICVLKKLATEKKRFIANILIALVLEIIFISLFHNSLEQIITLLISINTLLFLSLLK